MTHGPNQANTPNSSSPALPMTEEQAWIDQTKSIFPLGNYSQNVERWISPADGNYRNAFLTTQQQDIFFNDLIARFFGQNAHDKSPWNHAYIIALVGKNGMLQTSLDNSIKNYLAPDARFYGVNFRPLDTSWKARLRQQSSITFSQEYRPANRAISLRQTAVRMLPTELPMFGDPRKAGEGYPFDMLQNSAIHPGVPLYVAGVSADLAWSYVVSPEVIGWVKSIDIAKTDNTFINAWSSLAKKNLGAVVNDSASLVDHNGIFLFTARTGTLLPLTTFKGTTSAAAPVKKQDGYAAIHYAPITDDVMRKAPLAPTPENMSLLMKNMVSKPYGWGNLYNFNDCSAELRNLMLSFGLFLPRNSKDQAQSGNQVDLSDLPPKGRIEYLMQHGKPFTTLVYISGHVMLYIGNAHWDGQTVPMTYQNIWGLRPRDASKRSIIGQAAFFPLLLRYPEDAGLSSLVEKPVFSLTELN